MKLIEFRGAVINEEADSENRYADRGPVWIASDCIVGCYDHTVMTSTHKIRVMESGPEIARKINGCSARPPEQKDGSDGADVFDGM